MKGCTIYFFCVNDFQNGNDKSNKKRTSTSHNETDGCHWSLLVFEKSKDTFYHFGSIQGYNIKQAKKIANNINPTSQVIDVPTLQQANNYECGLHVIANAKSALFELLPKESCVFPFITCFEKQNKNCLNTNPKSPNNFKYQTNLGKNTTQQTTIKRSIKNNKHSSLRKPTSQNTRELNSVITLNDTKQHLKPKSNTNTSVISYNRFSVLSVSNENNKNEDHLIDHDTSISKLNTGKYTQKKVRMSTPTPLTVYNKKLVCLNQTSEVSSTLNLKESHSSPVNCEKQHRTNQTL